MLGKIDKHFAVQETSLRLRTFRQELLGTNLANGDTPGYKAVDFSFSAALQNALDGGGNQMSLARSNARHLEPLHGNGLGAEVLYRNEIQPSIDGNTVDSDFEMAQFSDNALRYQATLTFMNSKIRGLMTALTSK